MLVFWREHQNILFNTFNTLCSNEPSLHSDFPIENSAEEDNTRYINLIKEIQKKSFCNYYFGVSRCRLCGKSNGSAEYTFSNFIWPEGYIHYLKDHNVKIDDEFKTFLNIHSTELNIDATRIVNLMLFYVDWCPHSKSAISEWELLKEEYNGKNVNGYTIMFEEYNCTRENENLISKYNIKGFPTIKLIKNDQIFEYIEPSKPTKNTMEQFLNGFIHL
jgi:thiol-disulfide isomerase/thioredoxin